MGRPYCKYVLNALSTSEAVKYVDFSTSYCHTIKNNCQIYYNTITDQKTSFHFLCAEKQLLEAYSNLNCHIQRLHSLCCWKKTKLKLYAKCWTRTVTFVILEMLLYFLWFRPHHDFDSAQN